MASENNFIYLYMLPLFKMQHIFLKRIEFLMERISKINFFRRLSPQIIILILFCFKSLLSPCIYSGISCIPVVHAAVEKCSDGFPLGLLFSSDELPTRFHHIGFPTSTRRHLQIVKRHIQKELDRLLRWWASGQPFARILCLKHSLHWTNLCALCWW